MQGILADVNLLGHFRALLQILEGEVWHEVWAYLTMQNKLWSGC
jgi:hypothetical protein